MQNTGVFPATRMRRLRQNETLRGLARDVRLDVEKLVLPLFIRHGSGVKNPISSMPGHYQLSLDMLEDELNEIVALGIKQVMLFGIPADKDAIGRDACSDSGIIQSAIPVIKKHAPSLIVMTDVCFCEYTDHGHCGVIAAGDTQGRVDNDKTLKLLGEQAVSHARAGADIVAPSANMDGMVGAIRHALDDAGFVNMPILSYAVKYASSMYGPFRQAAEGAPQFGDRRAYQMDFANKYDGVREAALDIGEGADMLMVKPAHAYLDVICRVKEAFPSVPLAAYHTSGEFAMIKAAAEKGWVDEERGVREVLTAIHRAGADIIITYFAKDVAKWLR